MQPSSNGNKQARQHRCSAEVRARHWRTFSAAALRSWKRIRAHHTLAAMLWGRLTNSSKGWQIHREVSVVALGNRARLNCRNAWERACDDMSDQDLEGSDDADTFAGRRASPQATRFPRIELEDQDSGDIVVH